jgi:four helix bundle protein
MKQKIRAHHDLEVYRKAFDSAMDIFRLSRTFPKEETYSLTDQIRRSSRSVCANIAEGFRKRRYKAAMIAKYSDAETEAAETQVWLDFARQCQYLSAKECQDLNQQYDQIIGKLIRIMNNPDPWIIK